MFFFCIYIIILFHKLHVAPPCAELTVERECQSCTDNNGEGEITTLAQGVSCQITTAHTCQNGVCAGKTFSRTQHEKNLFFLFFWFLSFSTSLHLLTQQFEFP